MPQRVIAANGKVSTYYTAKEIDSLLPAESESTVSGVSSFNGRSGAVSPQSGDYTAAMVTGAVSDLSYVHTDNNYTTDEKNKLAGIEAGANNYSHPATHSADIITDGTSNKVLTTALKANYDSAYSNSHSHSNKTVLDNTTAAYATAEQTKLSGIAAGADVTGAANVGTAIHGAATKGTPVDNDEIAIIDSTSSNSLAKVLWSNIKATLKTYFDTLYSLVTGSTTNGNIKINGTETTVYTHPANHSPSVITQDSSNRFVTDAEKTAWNAKAGKDSPAFTGNPTAPTLSLDDYSTGIATTAYVQNQMNGYSTAYNETSYTGQCTKIASIDITSQYDEAHVTLDVAAYGNGGTKLAKGRVFFRVKQQDSLGSPPYKELTLFTDGVFTTNNFIAVTTVNSSSQTTVDLYYKELFDYNFLIYRPILLIGNVSLYSYQTYSSLPSGTQTASEYFNLLVKNYNSKATGDVSIAAANTWYTGASLSLPAGTYLISAQITLLRSTTTATTYSARISDGTNHYASAGAYMPSVTNHIITLPLTTIITLTSTTTINIQATANQTATIKAALVTNGAGNNATQISAIKVA